MGALATGGAIGATQIIGAKLQADAMRDEARFEAQQAEFNAKLTELQRQDVEAKRKDDIKRRGQETRSLLGSQRAALAASGVEVDSGSAAQIQEDTRSQGVEDVIQINNNAWREAWGLNVKASDIRTQSKFNKISAKRKSDLTLLTGGLNAAGSVAGYSYQGSK